MKRLISCIALFVSFISNAQVPQGINYQAVIRNTSGATVNNTAVGLRLNILQGSATGTVVYSESFSETTSNIGLVNVVLGQGNVLSGTFSSINWGSGSYFLEIAADANGGTNYSVMGTQQMMSVPYALYAENSATPGPQGPAGIQGPQGATGPQGPAGADGTNGQNGLSAYQSWLALGNIGTEADFIASLTGPQGVQGIQGPAGIQGPQGIPGAGIPQTLTQTGSTVTLSDGGGTININDADSNPTNEIELPSTPGTAGQVLTANGSGGVTWSTPTGAGGGAVMYIYNDQSCPVGWTKHEINVAVWGVTPVDACWTTQPCMVMYIYNGQSCPAGWVLHDISVAVINESNVPVDACIKYF
jgi:hypothetical protein